MIHDAQPRFTKDIDLFIKADIENANATYNALASFGAPLQGILPEDFTDANTFFRFVDFDAAWGRRVETVVDTTTGLTANFISANDLIASKLASGRARDLADVEDIRKALESQKSRPTE